MTCDVVVTEIIFGLFNLKLFSGFSDERLHQKTIPKIGGGISLTSGEANLAFFIPVKANSTKAAKEYLHM